MQSKREEDGEACILVCNTVYMNMCRCLVWFRGATFEDARTKLSSKKGYKWEDGAEEREEGNRSGAKY